MEKRNELGTVRTAEELIRMVTFGGRGEILVDGMINMGSTSLILKDEQLLRGTDGNSGLVFEAVDGSFWPLTLGNGAELDNLQITAVIMRQDSTNARGVVFVDGRLVRLRNISIRAVAFRKSCFCFSALFLCHRVEAKGFLRINVEGKFLIPINGNNAAPAILRMCPGSSLAIWVKESRRPVISRSMVELDNAEMEYSNYSENLPNEDFRDGYVFFIGACKITGNRADKMVLTKELGYTGRYRAKIINPVKEPESLNTSRPWWKVLLGIN